MGGNFTKIKLKGYLKNITDDELTTFSTNAIKEKEKYKFVIDKEKYIISIINSKKIILNRNNSEIESTIFFEENKKISSQYTLKENNITLDIDILTNKLEIKENNIKILYTVIDSDTVYEYNIEMSE